MRSTPAALLSIEHQPADRQVYQALKPSLRAPSLFLSIPISLSLSFPLSGRTFHPHQQLESLSVRRKGLLGGVRGARSRTHAAKMMEIAPVRLAEGARTVQRKGRGRGDSWHTPHCRLAERSPCVSWLPRTKLPRPSEPAAHFGARWCRAAPVELRFRCCLLPPRDKQPLSVAVPLLECLDAKLHTASLIVQLDTPGAQREPREFALDRL